MWTMLKHQVLEPVRGYYTSYSYLICLLICILLSLTIELYLLKDSWCYLKSKLMVYSGREGLHFSGTSRLSADDTSAGYTEYSTSTEATGLVIYYFLQFHP